MSVDPKKKLLMILGTSHFASLGDALIECGSYYGHDHVREAITNGSISIGPPKTKPDEKLFLRKNGQYEIHVYELEVASKIEHAYENSVQSELGKLEIRCGKIYLPSENLTRYSEIKKMLSRAGGRYNSKGFFSFPEGIDAESVLDDLLSGNESNTNHKKITQSFFSPKAVAEMARQALGDLKGKRVLEPSAGGGALADVCRNDCKDLVLVENHEPNAIVLRSKGYGVIEKDFLTVTLSEIGLFDAIISNPPFSNRQYITHFNHMWHFLKPGGVLAIITPQSWATSSKREEADFRAMMSRLGAEVKEIEKGAFSDSGTNVGTFLVVLTKPASSALEDKARPFSFAKQHGSQSSFEFA